MRLFVLIPLWFVLAARAVYAQSSVAASGRGRWTVAVYLGSSSGGPSSDLEATMVSGGYTDPFGGCDIFGCIPESPSPSSYSHANPLLLSLRYRVDGPYGAELLIGQSAAGTVSGRRQSEFLDIEYGGTLVAPVASIGARRVQVGLGPAFLRAHYHYRTMNGSTTGESSTSLGWLGTATVAWPIGPVFQLQGTGQYRAFGDARVRGAQVSGAHWYFAGGLGVTM
jgi:hypothetical protein